MIRFFIYLLLGLIQGIAEVLPISSSGHLVLIGNLLGVEEQNLTFEVFLHLASLLAIVIYLRKPIIQLIKGTWNYVFHREPTGKKAFQTLLMMVISTLPIVLFTILIRNIGYTYSPLFVIGICFIGNALMIFFLSRKKVLHPRTELNVKDAGIIGVFQCIGVFPGISRSGSCLSGAFSRKLDKEVAADYAFLLFIPAALGAFVLEIPEMGALLKLDSASLACYLASFCVAFVATYLSFSLLKKMIVKEKFYYFAYYCLILGILTIIYSCWKGWI